MGAEMGREGAQETAGADGVLVDLNFSPTDEMLCLLCRGDANVWRVADGECLLTLAGELSAVHFGLEDSSLACGDAGGSVRILNCVALYSGGEENVGIAESRKISRLSRGVTALNFDDSGAHLFVADTSSKVRALAVRSTLVEVGATRLGNFTLGYSPQSVMAMRFARNVVGLSKNQGALLCSCLNGTVWLLVVSDGTRKGLEVVTSVSVSGLYSRGPSAVFGRLEVELAFLEAAPKETGMSKPVVAAVAWWDAPAGINASTLLFRGGLAEAELRQVGRLRTRRALLTDGMLEGTAGFVAGFGGKTWAAAHYGASEVLLWQLKGDGDADESEDENFSPLDEMKAVNIWDFLNEADGEGDGDTPAACDTTLSEFLT